MLICPNVGHMVIEKTRQSSNVEFVQTDRSYSYIVLALEIIPSKVIGQLAEGKKISAFEV